MAKQKKRPTDKEAKPAGRTNDGDAASSQIKTQWWFQQADPVARFTGWLAIWTGILCLVTIGLGLVAVLQWRELHSTDQNVAEQAKIAADQLRIMRAGQRAWVSIISITIDGPLELDGDEAATQFKVHLRNTGNLPALSVHPVIHLYPNRRLTAFPPDCQLNDPKRRGHGIALFPNDTNNWGRWVASTKMGGETTPVPRDGQFTFGIVGCVLYASAGDPTQHMTGFTGYLIRRVPKPEDDPYKLEGQMSFDKTKTRYEIEELDFQRIPMIGEYAQ